MKVYIRTLWGAQERKVWWSTEDQREALRNYLMEMGFYVLHGPGDSLEVYALEYVEPVDIRAAKKILAIAKKSWYKMSGGKRK